MNKISDYIFFGILLISLSGSIILQYFYPNEFNITVSLISSLLLIIGFFNSYYYSNKIVIENKEEEICFYYDQQIKQFNIKYKITPNNSIFKKYFQSTKIDAFDYNTKFILEIYQHGDNISLKDEEDWFIKPIKNKLELYLKNSNLVNKELFQSNSLNLIVKASLLCNKSFINEKIKPTENDPDIQNSFQIQEIVITNDWDIPVYNYELIYPIRNISNFEILEIKFRKKERATIYNQDIIIENHSIQIEILYSQLSTISNNIDEQENYQLKSTLDIEPGIMILKYKINR